MNKKRFLGITLIIAIFIGLAITIVYIFTELKDETDIQMQKSESTDAYIFKQEYESLNDKENTDGTKNRSVAISENNQIVYAKASDIVSKIDNKESFIVYFGFDSCPWCRLIVEGLLNRANNYELTTIYYVDIKNIRDVYELNENHEAVRTTEGTSGYYTLLEKLNPVLSDYAPLSYTETKKVKGKKKTVTNTVKIDEKRIYAPNIIAVKDGVPTAIADGISSSITDPYADLTDAEKKYMNNEFDRVLSIVAKEKNYTCTESSNC